MEYFDAEKMVEMGERIKEVRKQCHVTQVELADELGITSEMVSRIENGKSACKTDHIYILCQLFNVSADYLLNGCKKQISVDDNIENKIIKTLSSVNEYEKDKIYRMMLLMLEQQPL